MKKIIAALTGFCIAISVNSQTPVPYRLKNGKFIYVDSVTMKPVITTQYAEAFPFEDGMARVNENEDPGIFEKRITEDIYINKKGEVIKAGKYPIAYPSNKYGETIVHYNGMQGLVDRNGKELIFPSYDDVSYFYDNSFTSVKIGDKYGLVDRTGKMFVPPTYFETYWPSEELMFVTNEPVFFGQTGKWGVVNAKGELVIPYIFESGSYFKNGVADVSRDGRNYLIDKTGREVELRYNGKNRSSFGNGYAYFERNGKFGFIDLKGNEAIPAIYDSVGGLVTNEMVQVSLNGKWGCSDTKGRLVIPCIYDEIWSFNDSEITVMALNGKKGAITKSGVVVLEPKYDYVSVINHEVILVELDKKKAVFDNKGKQATPFVKSQKDVGLYPSRTHGRLFYFDGAYRTLEGKIYKEN